MVLTAIEKFSGAELTSCDREPIHVPGSIQPHGALLALDPDELEIVHAGGDTEGLLGIASTALPGTKAARLLNGDQVSQLRSLLIADRAISRPLHAFVLSDPTGQRAIDVIVYRAGKLLVLEFDPQHEKAPENPLTLVQSMIRQVQRATNVQEFCGTVATEVRAVTGLERVMVYRFMPDGSGEVIAESAAPGVDSFLDLRYPESDIPKQARALYQTNWIRAIPDARYAPAPIFPTVNPRDNSPLDLSQSVIRSVSRVHCQYLAHMGVVASMSLSIILDGRLWGLIACHHSAPRYLPYRLREACELFAEMASSQLKGKLAEEHFAARARTTATHEQLVSLMSRESDLAEGLIRYRPNLRDFIPAGGVGVWIEGEFTGLGDTPSAAQIEALVGWLNENAKDGVFHTDCLSRRYPPAEAFANVASGLMALSVSKVARDYVLWFRPEVIKTVTWAGNPSKPVEFGPDGEFLTPRKSFAAWKESVHLHSAPWLGPEIDAAHQLRLSLLEVVLVRIDQLARERRSARLIQDQLMRDLETGLKRSQLAALDLKLETERRAAAEADLSNVLRRTVEDQEAERVRIARELHDTLGQSLTLLQLGLDGLGLASPDGNEMKQRIAGMKTLAADVGREVNRLAWEIRPTALDDLGIQNAIQSLIESWAQKSNVKYELQMTLPSERMSAPIETALYRVLQEALTNVVRHAGASHVSVILGRRDQHVTLIVEDDGRGFNQTAEATARDAGRLGLLGIRERLSLVGGSLEIESTPGKGTTLFARIPVTT
jgi:light-regulated signal transduction histidine kinase (bacteriophytochrome)